MITRHVAAGCTAGIIGAMPSSSSAASIIVPTLREAPNIEELAKRIFAATRKAGRETELIFVDDNSQDGIEAIVDSLRRDYPVRLIVRRTERGLSSAVLAGFREAKHDRFVVLDADLQHPPEMIPTILDRLDNGYCDFVIATRYGEQGSVASEWPLIRRLVSRIGTLPARPLAPLSDPLSGFFALNRITWERAAPLDPIGYKIALELYVKGGCSRPTEVPIGFAARVAGESKFRFAEQVRYLRHLSRLYRFRFPWLARILLPIILIGTAALILLIVRTVH